MAVAATSDKEHIQQMSNTADELLAVVKKYQSQIDELIKQNGPLTGALEKLEKGANTNRRQCGLKVKGKDKVTTTRDKREWKFCGNEHDTSACWELDTNKYRHPPKLE